MKTKSLIWALLGVLCIGIALGSAELEAEYNGLTEAWLYNALTGASTGPELNQSLNMTLYAEDYRGYKQNTYEDVFAWTSGGDNPSYHLYAFDNYSSNPAYKASCVYDDSTLGTGFYLDFTFNVSGLDYTNVKNISVIGIGFSGGDGPYHNLTIPDSCLTNTSLDFRFGARYNAINSYNGNLKCFNETGWQLFYDTGWTANPYNTFLCDVNLYVNESKLTAIYSLNGVTTDGTSAELYNLTNNGVTFRDGFIGGKYGYFDGTGYANYSNFPSVGDAVTISAWAYQDVDGAYTYPHIFGVNNVFSLYIQNLTRNPALIIWNNTNTAFYSISTKTFGYNEWHLWTGVYNNSYMQLFFDGEAATSPQYIGLINQSSGPLQIGNNWYNIFQGGIDDARIYNSALTTTEIQTLFLNGPPRVQDGVYNSSGVAGFANTTASINLSGTDAISVETYFTFFNTGQWQQVIEFGPYYSAYTDAWDMFLSPSGILYVSLKGDVGTTEKYYQLISGQTYHIVVTIDKGASPDETKFYVNGILQSGVYSSQSDNTNNFGNYPLYTGKRGYGGIAYPFNGSIGYVKIYDRVIPSWEVSQRYAAALAGDDEDYGINSINITIYDEETAALVTENITVQVRSNETEATYTTDDGYLMAYNTRDGTNRITFSGENYSTRDYIVTCGNGSIQTLSAYLAKTTSSVIFTIKNSVTKTTITGAMVGMYRLVGEEWQTVESKYSDVTGKAQFQYTAGEQYKFIITAAGYDLKDFILDPVLYATYDILIVPSASAIEQRQLYRVNVGFSPKQFYNGEITNLTFWVQSPYGILESYRINITFPNTNPALAYASGSGTESNGEIMYIPLNITGATYGSQVNISYFIETTLSSYSFNYSYFIAGYSTNKTYAQISVEGYGLGILEKMLIVVIAVALGASLAYMLAGTMGSMIMGLGIYGIFVYMGFVPIWSLFISIIIGIAFLVRGNR